MTAPAKPPTAPAVPAAPPAPVVPAAEAARVRKVVIADDSRDNLALLSEALKLANIEVYTADDGAKAIPLVEKHSPDLVLLDYNMPNLNGLETLKKLREKENYCAVIFVSANTDPKLIAECLDAGADDYIRKPFPFSELVARVKVRFRIRDLHEALKKANQQLQDLSEHDDLTGLFNMRCIYDKIEFELRRSRRYGRRMACVMMDMDHFKTINDGADHLFGSFVLKQVGRLVAQNIREVDLAARYGGDEFLIVLTEISPDGAEKFSERLRSVLGGYEFNDGKHSAKRTASLGFATAEPGSTLSAVELVRKADHALYEAKRAGRNRVVGHHYDK